MNALTPLCYQASDAGLRDGSLHPLVGQAEETPQVTMLQPFDRSV